MNNIRKYSLSFVTRFSEYFRKKRYFSYLRKILQIKLKQANLCTYDNAVKNEIEGYINKLIHLLL